MRTGKIAYLIDAEGGGAASHVLDLAGGMPRHGFAAQVLFFTPGPALEEARRRGIRTVVFPRRGSLLSLVPALAGHLRRERVDVLHTHTINANFVGRLAAALAGVPRRVATIHSHVIDELSGLDTPTLRQRLLYRLDLAMESLSTTIVTVAPGIRDRLWEEGVPRSKMRVIENGVDVARFSGGQDGGGAFADELGFPAGSKLIGTIGRLVPLKNHRVFLQAAAGAARRRPDVRFVVVGDGPLRPALEQEAARLGLEDRLRFAGWRSDVGRILRSLHAVVICSKVEGHNLVVLEAMAAGRPVIGTDVRGVNSIVRDGVNGLLVPVNQAGPLSDAILRLCEHDAEARRLGERGRRVAAQRYSLDRMLAEHVGVYRNGSPS